MKVWSVSIEQKIILLIETKRERGKGKEKAAYSHSSL
jgi:hypothetical protein